MVKYVTITKRLLASQKMTSIYGVRAQLQCDDICAEDSFPVWAERASPYSLTADTRGRQLFAALKWFVTGLLVRSCGICGGTKWRWGRFSPSSSVSPAIVVRSTNYSTITLMCHPGNAQ
jgi:hypothetical protein